MKLRGWADILEPCRSRRLPVPISTLVLSKFSDLTVRRL